MKRRIASVSKGVVAHSEGGFGGVAAAPVSAGEAIA
jgi:hypothetical protein